MLGEKTVFVAGAGGLGSPVISYLAAAGVGTLRICDADRVERSNLNRQILYTQDVLGEPKAQSALAQMSRLNPEVNVKAFDVRLEAENAAKLIGQADILMDCLDNYESRLVLNQFAVKNSIPLVHAGVQAMHGQLTVIHTPETPCLRCLLPKKTEEISPKPIVGAAAGVVGSLQALEAIKYLTGIGTTLKGRLLMWDGMQMNSQIVPIKRRDNCPICS